ncbi:hypothetical protein C8J57DRAFT_1244325 [Mycena rebaudengoi]|nr:hypothetical protein C8J57DRAFT_1244325 [Mycena rebaudengoi]
MLPFDHHHPKLSGLRLHCLRRYFAAHCPPARAPSSIPHSLLSGSVWVSSLGTPLQVLVHHPQFLDRGRVFKSLSGINHLPSGPLYTPTVAASALCFSVALIHKFSALIKSREPQHDVPFQVLVAPSLIYISEPVKRSPPFASPRPHEQSPPLSSSKVRCHLWTAPAFAPSGNTKSIPNATLGVYKMTPSTAGYGGCQLYARGMISTSDWGVKDGAVPSTMKTSTLSSSFSRTRTRLVAYRFFLRVFGKNVPSVDSPVLRHRAGTPPLPFWRFFLGRGRLPRHKSTTVFARPSYSLEHIVTSADPETTIDFLIRPPSFDPACFSPYCINFNSLPIVSLVSASSFPSNFFPDYARHNLREGPNPRDWIKWFNVDGWKRSGLECGSRPHVAGPRGEPTSREVGGVKCRGHASHLDEIHLALASHLARASQSSPRTLSHPHVQLCSMAFRR